jgi:hypothetical protein
MPTDVLDRKEEMSRERRQCLPISCIRHVLELKKLSVQAYLKANIKNRGKTKHALPVNG